MPGSEQRINIPATGRSPNLVGRLFEGSRRGCAAVICHPYPWMGGQMDDPNVATVQRVCARAGFTTLRFNFRGACGSSGMMTIRGVSEREDVVSACEYLIKNHDITSILLCGYSYGSAVASAVVDRLPEIKAYVAVSYPFGMLCSIIYRSHYPFTTRTQKPKLHIMGTNDNFTGIGTFNKWFDDMIEPKDKVIVEGADHFWMNYDQELLTAVRDWLSSNMHLFNES